MLSLGTFSQGEVYGQVEGSRKGTNLQMKCSPPDVVFSGVFQYYQAQLLDITNYTDLQPIVFQALREFGNAVIVFSLLENGLVMNLFFFTCVACAKCICDS